MCVVVGRIGIGSAKVSMHLHFEKKKTKTSAMSPSRCGPSYPWRVFIKAQLHGLPSIAEAFSRYNAEKQREPKR